MQKTLNSQDAFELSKSFHDLSVSLGNYRFENWKRIPEEERKIIESAEWSLLNASSDMCTDAVGLVIEETQISYEAILQSTSEIKSVLKHLEKFRKAVTIATAAVSLAGAIASRDLGAIGKTAKGLYDAVKKA